MDANYPDLTTVDSVCKISPDTLDSDLAGSEDFAKRFRDLKSQYEVAAKCAANVEQTFKEISLADLINESMTDTIDGDVAKATKTQNDISDLAAKMELANKAMKSVIKIHRAICMNAKASAQSSAEHGDEHH